ncbi:hypothetical protein C7999DRAFT_34929 [Corynascus novoguineensis]|uniref:Uncharacterized protein n=1 Tax=Corynascus novoguineensis TaxID=1126955 RepID=A0AAN7CM82_9PEZI|nr:hypothetical protein C7999DRAFT_34929 [Corynascus novoguineensis]
MESHSRAQTLPQPSSRDDRRGPEIYVHLEFRVSWGGKKQQPPKSHQVTFRSRNSRDRSPAFPRQVPAPNTNYLAAIHTFDQRQSRLRGMLRGNNPNSHHQLQEYYQGEQSRAHLQVPIIREPERPTRADGRSSSSHERGRSAPPPFGENPWDVNVPNLHVRDSDLPPSERRVTEIRRKPLPAPPSQFRLGEGGEPWSTWSLPDGYDPDAHPKDEEGGDYEDMPVVSPPADRNSTTFATNPTMVSTFSPDSVFHEPATSQDQPTSPERIRDVETGRARELGALSAAMMTVDNGFESQWWYQGRRDTVVSTGESPIHRWSTGPMSASTAASPVDTMCLPAGVVSPLTDAAFSPAQVPASLLQRTLSTRSEELWFREKTH